MILHVTPDEKFVPFLQGIFEEATPGGSLWRVLADGPAPAFAARTGATEVIDFDYFRSERFERDLRGADCLIFHSLNLPARGKLAALSRIPDDLPVVWRAWGYDYYGILKAHGLSLLLDETRALVRALRGPDRAPPGRSPGRALKDAVSFAARKIVDHRLIARIDYFSCCVPEDFAALQRVLPAFKARFLPLNYYSAEDVLLCGDGVRDLTGRDILLGNSAMPTNNHVEAMRVLGRLGMRGRKVVVPLSYGDTGYRDEIVRAGERILGEPFVPLKDYLPLPEYNRTVSSCGNLIMNSIRQQAVGNISSALLRGGKVFLRPENPIYAYYTRMGARVFPFGDEMTIADLDSPLDEGEVSRNKGILTGMWSRARGVEHVTAISLLRRRARPGRGTR